MRYVALLDCGEAESLVFFNEIPRLVTPNLGWAFQAISAENGVVILTRGNVAHDTTE